MNEKERKDEIKKLNQMLERNKNNDDKNIISLKLHWMELKEKLEVKR